MSLPIVGAPGKLGPDEVRARIQAKIPGAQVEVKDLTGTLDHYEVSVVAESFRGKPLIAQHQLVYGALAEELKGPIHALTLKTRAP